MQISLYTTLQKVAELPLTFTNTTTSSVFQVHAVCPFFLLQFCPSVHLFINLVLLFSSSHNRHPMPRFDVSVNFHFPFAVERIVSANVKAK